MRAARGSRRRGELALRLEDATPSRAGRAAAAREVSELRAEFVSEAGAHRLGRRLALVGAIGLTLFVVKCGLDRELRPSALHLDHLYGDLGANGIRLAKISAARLIRLVRRD